MTTNTHNTDPALQHYLNSIGQSEHPVLTALRERTQSHRLGKMAIAQEQAAMLVWLAKLLNAQKYLEVGVFTGYSSTAMALTLDDLIAQGESESYDLALIDADKPPTPKYFERCLQLVRSGGVIAIDNILLGGRVMNEAARNDPPSLDILRHFNQNLPHDTRIIPITLPVGDGLTFLLKK